eukprot:2900784-Amphidinium_carterae.1
MAQVLKTGWSQHRADTPPVQPPAEVQPLPAAVQSATRSCYGNRLLSNLTRSRNTIGPSIHHSCQGKITWQLRIQRCLGGKRTKHGLHRIRRSCFHVLRARRCFPEPEVQKLRKASLPTMQRKERKEGALERNTGVKG